MTETATSTEAPIQSAQERNQIMVPIPLQPKQRELSELYENSESTILGFGGALGGAKSFGGRAIMFMRRIKYPNTTGWIIRRTLEDLRDNHILPLFKEYPILRLFYNKQEKRIGLPNGSQIRFISAPNQGDIFDLVGKEAADIFVDQAEQFTQEELEFLATRNRDVSNMDITAKMLWTFNPGDLGHAFLRRIFIERDFEPNEEPSDYTFLEAHGWDNIEWSRKTLVKEGINDGRYYEQWTDDERLNYFIYKTRYGKRLNSRPEQQRKAELYGDWYTFVGQFLSMWRRGIHIVPKFDPPQDWEIVGALDYGQRTCLEVMCRHPETQRIVNFGECYTEHQTPTERAEVVVDFLQARQLNRLTVYYDTDMDIDLTDYRGYEKTPLYMFNQVFERCMGAQAPQMFRVSKKSQDRRNYRIVCNEAMKEHLLWKKDEKGEWLRKPMLVFTEDCKQFFKTAPLLLHDEHSPEGLDFVRTPSLQDPFDAVKYALMALLYAVKKPEKKKYGSFDELLAERDENAYLYRSNYADSL